MKVIGFLFLGLPLLAQEGPSEAELHVRKLRPAEGMKLTLWAAEPQLQNPVAIAHDEKGRLFVAETHRYRTSVLDIRHYLDWYQDDLACRSVEDREAMVRRRMGERASKLVGETERVRLLEDKDGDGRADASTVFAEGFNTMSDGIASGLLARGGDVYFANVPNLWVLKDRDGDGKADDRYVMHSGFGVRFSLTGHDFHGLAFGPDGKLYFTMGDRGLNVLTKEKRKLEFPDMGATLRCNPDGSDLEVFAIGQRNPQELAFDKFGNLWTGDNDADVNDEARWVWVVEGGDSGWRVGYQFSSESWGATDAPPPLGTRSPWITEELWKGHAPYLVPPVGFLGTGPSGLAYYPGTGLPAKYENHFFLCEFPGGVKSFTVKPKGAGFEIADSEKFLWEGLPTDCSFGPDGALYVSDWVEGWEKTGKGRIFRVSDPESQAVPEAKEAKRLISEGLRRKPTEELGKLLAHPDQRVRMAAQFALVPRERSSEILADIASRSNDLLARLHAIWGLGMLFTRGPLIRLLKDPEPEVRAQAARVLGDRRIDQAYDTLLPLLKDPSPRVRFYAAIAVGKLGRVESVGPIVELLRANDDQDAYLRHAGVFGLAWIGNTDALMKHAKDKSPAVRMGVLLALRRLGRLEVRTFLKDPDLAYEAARAINDSPIAEAMPDLAALLGEGCPEKALLRAVNANFRTGGKEGAGRLAAFARRAGPVDLRIEALRALASWEKPSGRDRVTGLWRPLAPRDPAVAREALQGVMAETLKDPETGIRVEAALAAAGLALPDARPALEGLFLDKTLAPDVRARALRALGGAEAVRAALSDANEALRLEGVRLVPASGIKGAAALLEKVVAEEKGVPIRQAAVTALGGVEGSDAALARLLDALSAGTVAPALHLEVLEAAAKRATLRVRALAALKDERAILEGGDPGQGYRIFFERGDAQCARCHRVKDRGADVGPNLSTVGSQRAREHLLASILRPNQEISEGYGQVVVATKSDAVEVGRVERETDKELILIQGDGSRRTIHKDQIKARKPGLSAMPDDASKTLSKRDLRDLVAYLSGLRVD